MHYPQKAENRFTPAEQEIFDRPNEAAGCPTVFTMKKTPELGDKAKDTISGFTGIVVAVTDWLNGCRRITIQPQKMENGKPVDSTTFDVEQVEVLKSAAMPKPERFHGGPSIPPIQRPDPVR